MSVIILRARVRGGGFLIIMLHSVRDRSFHELWYMIDG